MRPIIRTNAELMPSIFNDILEENFPSMRIARTRQMSIPSVNIIESEENFQIELAAAGLTKEDLRISLEKEDTLSISYEKKQTEETDTRNIYHQREFFYGSFTKSFILPENIEKEQISAKMENGILTVTLPKKKAEEVPGPRDIAIC